MDTEISTKDFLIPLEFTKEESNNVSTIIEKITQNSAKEQEIEDLVACLIEKAQSDSKYGRPTAKLCSELARKQGMAKSPPTIRNILLSNLQASYKSFQTRESVQEKKWLAFVNFFCSIFDIIRINGTSLTALALPIINCLSSLAKLENSGKEDMVELLFYQLQFIGEELEKINKDKMTHLCELLREMFLSKEATQFTRLLLIQILELRAGDWKLSPAAHEYYYGGLDIKSNQ